MLGIHMVFLTCFLKNYDLLKNRVLSRSILLEIFVLWTINPLKLCVFVIRFF